MKKTLLLLLALLMSLSIVACDSDDSWQEDDDEKDSKYEKYEDIFDLLEDGDYEGAIEEIQKLAEKDDNEENPPKDPPLINPTPTVTPGQWITTDRCEFALDFVNIEQKIVPPAPDDFYSYYEADHGKVYVDFCFAYKNTHTADVDADEIVDAKLIYDDKYEYTGFSIVEEDNRSDFTYANITSIAPLCTEYIHYLFEVPEEVKNGTQSIEITFTIHETTYTYTVR
ncbi:MAG: hypothetical protein J6R82_02705 [Clostridia bacterium]|nr:hypothetical protein [Clostridia bacterium]